MARVSGHTSEVCLNVKISPNMPRTKSKAISKGNVPISPKRSGFGELTMMAEIYRVLADEIDNHFDRMITYFNQQDKRSENTEKENRYIQRLEGLQHQAQQPHLAITADGKQDKKTRDSTDDVAPDERYGDISCVRVKDPISQTSFGDEEYAELPALAESSDNALVDEGTEAPKPCRLTLEMSTLTPTGGLLHAGLAN